MGLVREQVFAYLFGAGNATDAFNVAFRIPNLLRNLFAEGAMSAALVPVFTEVREREGEARSWEVAGRVFRVLGGISLAVALVGLFASPVWVGWYAPGFQGEAGKTELTVLLTRIMFPFFPLVVLAAAYMSVLNSVGVFFLPGLASALFNLTSVITGLGLALIWPKLGGREPIVGMALGVIFGGFVQAYCQWPALRRAGYHYRSRPGSWWHDESLRKILRLMTPGVLGLGATQISVLINTLLATSQESGAVSWLNYAFRLMQFPIGIFGASIAAATLPEVSRCWVQRNAPGASDVLVRSLRQVMAVSLPASAGLAFLAVPIVRLLFEHGQFTSEHTIQTARALAGYSLGLAAYCAVKVLVPAFYALGNTRVPVLSSVFSVAVAGVLNVALIGPLGFAGLAIGTSIAAILNAVLLLFALRSELKGVGFRVRALLKSLAAYGFVALLMGLACSSSHQGLLRYAESSGIGTQLLILTITIFEGLIITVAIGRIFGLAEILELTSWLRKKLKKKLSPRKE